MKSFVHQISSFVSWLIFTFIFLNFYNFVNFLKETKGKKVSLSYYYLK